MNAMPHAYRPHRRRVCVALACLLALCVLAGAGCDQKKNTYAPPPPPKVTVARPTQRPVTDYLLLTGNSQAAESVDLRARVEGFLKSVEFKDGAIVKKGATLFTIEPQTYETQLKEAQSVLAGQQTRLARAEVELSRAKKLLEAKAGPETDVIRWTQERDSARADVDTAKAKVDLAQINLGYAKIVAPFDGRIGRKLVDPGNLVGAGDRTRLATLVRLDPIHAYFTLNERDYLRLSNAAGLTVPAANAKAEGAPKLEMGLSDQEGYPFQGRLDFRDLGVDPQTGTVLLRGVFPNPDGVVVPGLFVRIRIPLEVRDAILIPETAVGLDQRGRFVLVLGDNNVVEQRPVQVGQSVNGERVIEKGLTLQDRVIVAGIQLARPGAPVVPEEAAPKQANP